MKKALIIAGIIGAGIAANEVNAQSAKDYKYLYENVSRIGVSDAEDYIDEIADKNPRIEDWNDDKQGEKIALSNNRTLFDIILKENGIYKNLAKQNTKKEKYGATYNPKTNEHYLIEVTKDSRNPHKIESVQLSVFDGKSGWFKRGYYDESVNNSKNYITKKSKDAFLVGDARNGVAEISLDNRVKSSTMKALNAAFHDDFQYVMSAIKGTKAPKKTYKPEMDPNMRILLNLPRK